MCSDTLFLQDFKKDFAHFQVLFADTVNFQTYCVCTWVKYAVFAGYCVFERQQIVAVFKFKYIFGFASVDFFHKKPPEL